jgi:hypothetical protein
MLVPVTIPSQSAPCLRVIVDEHIAIEVPTDFDPTALNKVIACLTLR